MVLLSRRGGRRRLLVALVAVVVVVALVVWAVVTYVVRPRQAVSDAAAGLDRVDGVIEIPEEERPDVATLGDGDGRQHDLPAGVRRAG